MASLSGSEPLEIGVREARANFSHYLRQARAGIPVVVKSRGEPDVEIHLRAPAEQGLRPWGLMKGKIKYLTDDWDAPMTDAEIDEIEDD